MRLDEIGKKKVKKVAKKPIVKKKVVAKKKPIMSKQTAKILAKPIEKKGWDIKLVTDPHGNVDEMYEVYFNGEVVGDIQNQGSHLDDFPNFSVLHYDTDLSWDMVDTLSDAYELIKDTHREYMGGELKESTALSQQYGGKKAKVLSYSQAVRWLARDFPDGGYQGEHFSDYALAIATIYGRDKKEVERDAEHAYNAMRAAGK